MLYEWNAILKERGKTCCIGVQWNAKLKERVENVLHRGPMEREIERESGKCVS